SSGVTVVAAAGNDSGSAAARVPAAYNEVITVSALADTDGKPGGLGGHRCYSWGSYDTDDTFANFSNYGSDVDLIAPGKCIWSTIPGGYQYMSGTSMAVPHVTGAIALLKASRPGMTPAEVREALIYLGSQRPLRRSPGAGRRRLTRQARSPDTSSRRAGTGRHSARRSRRPPPSVRVPSRRPSGTRTPTAFGPATRSGTGARGRTDRAAA